MKERKLLGEAAAQEGLPRWRARLWGLWCLGQVQHACAALGGGGGGCSGQSRRLATAALTTGTRSGRRIRRRCLQSWGRFCCRAVGQWGGVSGAAS